jgi:tRNA nucleotidyltransferase (CCA-adding enzyme)
MNPVARTGSESGDGAPSVTNASSQENIWRDTLRAALGQFSENDPLLDDLAVYVVGGAVRDAMLGLPAGDLDWVVVGATPEQMEKRGFIPVGGDFPVFLHPRSKEEYALARTERKSGRGYKGFTFYTGADVTLEDDLKRRDLTINAMAYGVDDVLVDPLGGQRDLASRTLRHVGDAFIEDPVRLLRLARFAARFHEFSIAPETMRLARQLVQDGEVDALVPERVWQEIAKGLSASQPGRMFQVLQEAGALARVMPALVFDDQISEDLAQAALRDRPLAGRFALLCRHSADPSLVAQQVRAPGECRDQAILLASLVARAQSMRDPVRRDPGVDDGMVLRGSTQDSLDTLERCDALRKPERFLDVLQTASIIMSLDLDWWSRAVQAVRGIDAGAIARAAQGEPARIKAGLREARLQALAAV